MTKDVYVFGRNEWVYCKQHMRPHLTGWCTVDVKDKVGLGISNYVGSEEDAYKKCREFGLELYEDIKGGSE